MYVMFEMKNKNDIMICFRRNINTDGIKIGPITHISEILENNVVTT
jgi:hypothetical protein